MDRAYDVGVNERRCWLEVENPRLEGRGTDEGWLAHVRVYQPTRRPCTITVTSVRIQPQQS